MAIIKLPFYEMVQDEDWFLWSNETYSNISVIKFAKPVISLSRTQSTQTVKCIYNALYNSL